jgi:hypothetical protein
VPVPEAVEALVAGREGQLVAIKGLTLRLCTSPRLRDLLEHAPVLAAGMVSAFMRLPGKWVPSDAGFARLFKRPTWKAALPRDAAVVMWVDGQAVGLEVADAPLECWLEAVRPLWLRELAAREVRQADLARQAQRVARTSAGADAITATLCSRLEELNAQLYQRALAGLLPSLRAARPSLVSLRLRHLGLEAEVPSPLTPTAEALVRELDEEKLPEGAAFDLLQAVQLLRVDVDGVEARVRSSSRPFLVVEQVRCVGTSTASCTSMTVDE